MNHEYGRDPDHGWADPEGSRILAKTLIAMADGVDPFSPTGPAANVGAMAGSVRRRRAAKYGMAGGGALAVAAVLMFGGPQLVPDGGAAPVLPGNPSPSGIPVEPSPAPTVAEVPLVEGRQPRMLRGTDLRCGAAWNDVETAEDVLLEIHGAIVTQANWSGDEWEYGESARVRAVDADGHEVAGDDLNWPTLVWTDLAGRVVDVGDWDPFPFTHTENVTGVVQPFDDRVSPCVDAGDRALPDGSYQVRAVTVRDGDDGPEIVAGYPASMIVSGGERSEGWSRPDDVGDEPIDRPDDPAEPIRLPAHPDESILDEGGVNSLVLDSSSGGRRWIRYNGDLEAAEKLALAGVPFEVRGRCTRESWGGDGPVRLTATLNGTWSGESQTPVAIPCDGSWEVVGDLVYEGEAFSIDGDVGIDLWEVGQLVAQAELRLVPADS